MTIEIFETNVSDLKQAGRLVAILGSHFTAIRVNFDLHDCDNILRVEGSGFTAGEVVRLMHEEGVYCRRLD